MGEGEPTGAGALEGVGTGWGLERLRLHVKMRGVIKAFLVDESATLDVSKRSNAEVGASSVTGPNAIKRGD